jgi:hypothetical protein
VHRADARVAFHNVEHVCTRVDRAKVNVLALIEEPTEAEVLAFRDPRFAPRSSAQLPLPMLPPWHTGTPASDDWRFTALAANCAESHTLSVQPVAELVFEQ